MNHQRRELLKTALGYIDEALTIVITAKEQEQSCLDRMPDALMDSEQYEKLECSAEQLEEAENGLEEVKQAIAEAIA